VDVARLVVGGTALLVPGRLLRATGSTDGPGVRRVTRVLGARYLLQAGAGLALHRPWVAELDGAVDLVHAASMLPVAVALPAQRRLALTSAVVAVACAAADLRGRRDGGAA
jgi:hypothetical protein